MVGKIRTDGLYVVNYQRPRNCARTRRLMSPRAFYMIVLMHRAKNRIKNRHLPAPSDLNALLLKMLAHENIASRAPIFEMYDKQVQGRTVIEAGEADAGVMQPFNDDKYPEEIRQYGIALIIRSMSAL